MAENGAGMTASNRSRFRWLIAAGVLLVLAGLGLAESMGVTHVTEYVSQMFGPRAPEVAPANPQPPADPDPQVRLRATLSGHAGVVSCGAFSPDGKLLVTGSWDKTVSVWDVASGQELFTLKGHTAGIRTVVFSPDGTRLVTAGEDKTPRLWDLATREELPFLPPQEYPIYCVAFSPDGKVLATGTGQWKKGQASPPGQVRLWDAATGQELAFLKGHAGDVWSISFSPDGKRLATGDSTGVLRLWDVAEHQQLATMPHQFHTRPSAFAPDGKTLAMGQMDGVVKLWDLELWRERASLDGHKALTFTVAFSPDGKTLATASKDETVKLWNLATGEVETPITLQGHKGQVWFAVFSPDGRTVASGGDDKTVKLWDLPGDLETAFARATSGPAQPPIVAKIDGKAARVALVSTGGGDAARNVLDLATAQLSSEKNIDLLERTALDRVLAEQQLSLSGLVDAKQALVAGKLLSVDLFAVVETAPESKEALGLVVFDANTGVRLWDTALPAGLKSSAAAVAAGVRSAAAKRAAGADNLRTVCLLSVRNADLPREMDSFCEALGLLLERRLLSSASVALMERKRLEFVNQEAALPKDAPEKALLASVVRLELEVQRGKQGEGLRATVLVTGRQGKLREKVSAEAENASVDALMQPLLGRVLLCLEAAPVSRNVDRFRESSRFLQEGQLLRSHGHFRPAIQALESAYALDPADQQKEALLAESLLNHAAYLLDPRAPGGFVIGPYRLEVSSDDLKASLGVARRGLEIRTNAFHQVQPKSLETLVKDYRLFSVFEQRWRIYLNKLAFAQVKPDDAEAERLLESFRASADRFLREAITARAEAAESEPAAFAAYTGQIQLRLEQFKMNARDATGYTKALVSVTQRWLEVARQQEASQVTDSAYWLLIRLTEPDDDYGSRWKLGANDYAQLGELFGAMEQHSHPLLRLYGRSGQLWVGLRAQQLSPADCHVQFQDIKKAVFDLIEHPEGGPDEVRTACYRFLLHALTRLTFGGNARWEESLGLSHFMLARGEMMSRVVTETLSQGPSTKPENLRRLQLIEQALEVADSPDCRFLDGSRTSVKKSLESARTGVLSSLGELPPPRFAEPPWKEVRTLVHVSKLRGIATLLAVVPAGDKLYAVGRGSQGGRSFLQLIRVPLDGESPQLLGQADLSIKPSDLASQLYGPVRTCCVGDGGVYVALRAGGLYAFDLEGNPARRLGADQQLPSDTVEAMAFLDGKLYAALSGGYLVAFDPAGRGCQVLASSRRKEKASPFDDSVPFTVPYMVADPKRGRILFTLYQGPARSAPDGLWEFDVGGGTFTRRIQLYEKPTWGSPVRDGRILLSSPYWALAYDLAQDKPELLWSSFSALGPDLPQEAARCKGYYPAAPPHLVRDGWLWCGSPFGRLALEKGLQENFPGVTEKSGTGAKSLLEFLSDEQLLVGDPSGLWLVTLEKRK